MSNVDEAFVALDRGWRIKDAGLLSLKVDPALDPLRGDPRYSRLIKAIGFPD